MRITEALLAQEFSQQLTQINDRMSTDQQQISSGKRILQPSDDPTGAVHAAAINTSLSQLQGQTTVAKDAQSWLGEEDSTLQQVYTLLQQANDTAVEGANPLDTQQGAALATQVDALKTQMLSLANTQVDGRYLFAGFQTTTQPFTDSGGTVSYAGDTGVKTVTVSGGVVLSLSHPGSQVFGVPPAGTAPTPGQPSIFDTLSALSTALSAGSSSGVSTCMDQLKTQMTSISTLQAETGTREQQVTLLQNTTAQQTTLLTGMLSNTQDADFAQVAVDLQQQQNTYQAVTYVASVLGKEGLLQWLH